MKSCKLQALCRKRQIPQRRAACASSSRRGAPHHFIATFTCKHLVVCLSCQFLSCENHHTTIISPQLPSIHAKHRLHCHHVLSTPSRLIAHQVRGVGKSSLEKPTGFLPSFWRCGVDTTGGFPISCGESTRQVSGSFGGGRLSARSISHYSLSSCLRQSVLNVVLSCLAAERKTRRWV